MGGGTPLSSVHAADANTVEISTAAELFTFLKDVASNDYSGKTVKLTKDIELTRDNINGGTAESWIPSGAFAGIFDGQDHTLTLDPSRGPTRLFDTLDGTIRNVTVKVVESSSDTYSLVACLTGTANNLIIMLKNGWGELLASRVENRRANLKTVF